MATAFEAALISLGLLLVASGCQAPNGPSPADRPERAESDTSQTADRRPPDWTSSAPFVEGEGESGLDFHHFNGMSGELYLAEITCGGGALADFDNDGDLDVYLLQGGMVGDHPVEAALSPPRHPVPLTDRLYRNDLDANAPATGAEETPSLSFTDVTESIGVAVTGYGCGVATADFDNDGWIDLYLTRLGPNRLLRNLGAESHGTLAFEDITAEAGVEDAGSGVTATFFDADRDGWLDLFVGNNVTFDNTGRTVCRSLTGAPDYCGPGAYPAEADRLFRNTGDRNTAGTGQASRRPRFEDVTTAAGLSATPKRPTLGAVVADFDRDGWPDLYVANDGEPNHLWIGHGGADGLGFVDQAMLAGSALNADGAAEASMGVAAGDFDDDGDFDLLLAHLVKETNTLYENDGRGGFTDATNTAGLGASSLPYTSFGAGFLDFDNDGRLDLLVVNGAVTQVPELVAAGDPFPLHQRNQLFRNSGGSPAFEEVSGSAGKPFERSEVSRGAAFGDLDNDGAVDVLVINNGGPARLLINRAAGGRPWLGVRLVGGPGPRDLLGATAAVLRDGRPTLWRRAATDGSYGSASDPRIVFGLSDGPEPEGVRVVWPDGTTEDFADLELGRYHTLRQGTVD